MPEEAKTEQQNDGPIKPDTKHNRAIEAIYEKRAAEEAEVGIPVDTSKDGFADAMGKLYQARSEMVANETGQQLPGGEQPVDLSMVRGNQRGQPQPNAAQVLNKPESEPDPNDPFATGELFYDNGVLCTTVTVNGQAEVVPWSKARRGYQTAAAANKKFIEASQLYNRANELASQPRQSEHDGSDQDIMDQILTKEAEIDDLMLAGEADQLKEARRELYQLRSRMNQPNAGNPSFGNQAVPPHGANTQQIPDADVIAADNWFATEYAAVQNDPALFQEAVRRLNETRENRARQGLPPLSPFELVQDVGQQMENYLAEQGMSLDRYERTQRRREADVTPTPASTSQQRRQPTSGAGSGQNIRTPEDEVNDALDYVRSRGKLQEQFKSQGANGGLYQKM